MTQSHYDLGSRYQFERVLGRGGMGVVLRARDTVLNRPVAVKLLSEEIAHIPEAHDIFLTEGRALADLSHPNLVRVFDVVDEGSKAMMVLEYVEGINLDDRYRQEGRLEQAMAVDCAIQLCNALTYLHDNGYIHRDLKPANVMVQPDGTIKLIDFGLARSLDVIWERGTRVRGSPAYMAPEQVTGERLTFVTDIYALGTTLFELLSGNVPFVQGDMSFAQVHREPPPLAERVEGLHPSLYVLVDQCLRKRPEERPASTRAVGEALRRIAEDLQKGEIPEHVVEMALGNAPTMDQIESKQPEASRKSKAPGVLLAAVVLAGLGIGWAFWSHLQTSTMPPTELPQVELTQVESLPSTPTEDVEKVDAVEPAAKLLGLALAVGSTASEAAAPVSETGLDVVRPSSTRRSKPAPEAIEKKPDVPAEVVVVAPVPSPDPVAQTKSQPEPTIQALPLETTTKPVVTKIEVKQPPKTVEKVDEKPVEKNTQKKPAAPLSF